MRRFPIRISRSIPRTANRESAISSAPSPPINSLDPAPDLIFHTGDIAHNGRADEYAAAAAVLAKARAPVYVIPGNKDDRDNLRKAFRAQGYLSPDSPFIDYTVEDYPVRLIALDTLNPQSNKGDFDPDRARRLIDMIDADTAKPIAVFAHHPPFVVPVGPDPIHFDPPDAMTRLAEALQHSDRIVGLFSGHVHRPAEGRVGKVPAIVMPCIATTLRKGDYPAAMTTRPIYYLHRYEPAWGFITEARVV